MAKNLLQRKGSFSSQAPFPVASLQSATRTQAGSGCAEGHATVKGHKIYDISQIFKSLRYRNNL